MTVHTEVRGATLIITLDVPKANAINVATSMELYESFVRLRDDAALRSAILTGAGRTVLLCGMGPQGRRRGRSRRRSALPWRLCRADGVL